MISREKMSGVRLDLVPKRLIGVINGTPYFIRHGEVAYTEFPETGIAAVFAAKDAEGVYRPLTVNEMDGMSEADMLAQAINNINPLVCPITKMVGGYDDPDFPLYVITNHEQFSGASAFFHPAVQKALAEKFPHGYWLIPSSRHELLAVPKDADKERFNELIGINEDVNRTVVSDRDYLADGILEFWNGSLIPARV